LYWIGFYCFSYTGKHCETCGKYGFIPQYNSILSYCGIA
jgi:hypothetical protein